MTIAQIQGLTGILSEAQLVANELGIDSWQLYQGSYNGVIFHVQKTLLGSLNDKFNPLAGVYDNAKTILGITTQDNDNTNLPYGTSTTSTGISDTSTRKVAIFSVPNHGDVFETLGWNGDTYVMKVIIWGASYQQAMDNLTNGIVNEDSSKNAPTGEKHKLIHPVLGPIQGKTYLIAKRQIHNPMLWRSVMVELIFRTTNTYGQIVPASITNASAITNKIASGLAIINSIASTWGDITAIANGLGNNGNSVIKINELQTIQSSIFTTLNTNVNTMKLLVDNLKPISYDNIQLTNTPSTPDNNIPKYFYFISNMTPQDANVLVTNNNTQIQENITLINNMLNSNSFYNTITQLIALQSSIIQLAFVLINSFYGQLQEFTLPYSMDLMTVCFLNKLNYYTQSEIIYSLNKNVIQSGLNIKKDTILLLPKDSA
jgi:hypothetical protein